MLIHRSRAITRIKDVEREYRGVYLAVERLRKLSYSDPTQLAHEVEVRDLDAAFKRLEGTYLIRLFAEFEATLRSFWKSFRPTSPPVKTLVDSIAARRIVTNDLVNATHQVREYRNSLVHQFEEEQVEVVDLGTARSSLCTFLSRLPEHW